MTPSCASSPAAPRQHAPPMTYQQPCRPHPRQPPRRASLPDVPDADFTTFRAVYLRELPDAAAAAVDARFRHTLATCDTAIARGGATPATVADLVHALLNPAPADSELTVDIRALQVAAWNHDLYVKVDLPRLLHNEERPRLPPHLSDEAMTAYRQPYRAITVALTRAGHALQDLTAITLADAAATDGSVACGDTADPTERHRRPRRHRAATPHGARPAPRTTTPFSPTPPRHWPRS